MALRYRTVPIVFDKGLDTKSDSLATLSGSFRVLENCIFQKRGVLTKRNGYDALGNLIENAGGALSSVVAGAVYNDELLAFTGTSCYSYSESTGFWQNKGRVTGIVANAHQVVRNGSTQSNSDVAYLASGDGGIFVHVWETDAIAGSGVHYQVEDATTGAIITADTVVSATGASPRVISFDHIGDIVIFYVGTGANAGKLYFRKLSSSNPKSLSTEVNLVASLVTTANTYDVIAVSDRIWIAWNDTTPNVKLTYLTSDYTYTSGRNVSPLNASGNCISMWSDTSERLWVAGANATDLYIAVVNRTTGASLSVTLLESIANVKRVSGFTSPGTSTATVYYEISSSTTYNTKVRKNTMIIGVGAGAATDFLRSVGLGTRCFSYDSNFYVGLIYDSTLQATTLFANVRGDIVTRVNTTIGGPLRSKPSVSSVVAVGGTQFAASCGQKGALSVSSGVLFTPVGVTRVMLDFDHPNKFMSAQVGQILLVAGGCLQAYDGTTFSESGFHLFPEALASDVTTDFAVSTPQQGIDGAQVEKTQVICCSANRIKSGQYFTINAQHDTTQYYVWFNVDGAGGDPAPIGKTGIQVSINNYGTNQDVAIALNAAVAAVSADFTSVRAGQIVTISTTSFGTATDSANAAGPNGVSTGSIGANSHLLYKAVYEWTDRTGMVHRSAPSQALSITSPGSTASISIAVPTLRITAKSGVRIALYRTTSDGSIYYRVNSTQLPLNQLTMDLVYVMDTLSDTSLIGNELLYTNAGVLDHIAPDSCSIIATYRGRAFLAGLPDPNKVSFTTQATADDPAAFCDALTLQCDSAGGKITGIGIMDDKVIFFKEAGIQFVAGQGPNDLGELDDFGDPTVVVTDAGCNSAKSVTQTPDGLVLQSKKGVYLLDRSMLMKYVGMAVEDYNDRTITGAAMVPDKNHVRFITNDNTAAPVYDYLFGLWSTFTGHAGVWCGVWRGKFTFLRSNGVAMVDNPDKFADGNAVISLRVVTGAISPAGLDGYARIKRIAIRCQYRGAHTLIVKLSNDDWKSYRQIGNFDAGSVLGSGTYGSSSPYGAESVYGGTFAPEIVSMGVGAGMGKCTSFSLSIQDNQTIASEGLAINGFAVDVGTMTGVAKTAANRKI